MSLAQSMIQELQHESATTRRFLERIPADRLEWRPHEKSLTTGQLALHLATIPGFIGEMASHDSCPPPDFEGGFKQPADVVEILAAHDESLAKAIAILEGIDDARMAGDWTMAVHGETVMTMPRAAFLRFLLLNHAYHHRGQLGVYLRLAGAEVPSAYGPSGDEMPAEFERMRQVIAKAAGSVPA